jgi:hypothetical protein
MANIADRVVVQQTECIALLEKQVAKLSLAALCTPSGDPKLAALSRQIMRLQSLITDYYRATSYVRPCLMGEKIEQYYYPHLQGIPEEEEEDNFADDLEEEGVAVEVDGVLHVD